MIFFTFILALFFFSCQQVTTSEHASCPIGEQWKEEPEPTHASQWKKVERSLNDSNELEKQQKTKEANGNTETKDRQDSNDYSIPYSGVKIIRSLDNQEIGIIKNVFSRIYLHNNSYFLEYILELEKDGYHSLFKSNDSIIYSSDFRPSSLKIVEKPLLFTDNSCSGMPYANSHFAEQLIMFTEEPSQVIIKSSDDYYKIDYSLPAETILLSNVYMKNSQGTCSLCSWSDESESVCSPAIDGYYHLRPVIIVKPQFSDVIRFDTVYYRLP